MDTTLNTAAKQIGDKLIDLSDALDAQMEKWSDATGRPNGLGDTECVGFISKETAEVKINMVVDIQAPADAHTATLRTWAIKSEFDADQNERFNNIQLDFEVDYSAARAVTGKGAAVTRDDIREVLHGPGTQLSRVIVSNQAGMDKTSEQPLGERYDLAADVPDQAISSDAVITAMDAVLPLLQSSASA